MIRWIRRPRQTQRESLVRSARPGGKRPGRSLPAPAAQQSAWGNSCRLLAGTLAEDEAEAGASHRQCYADRLEKRRAQRKKPASVRRLLPSPGAQWVPQDRTMASSAAARDQPKVTPSGRLWDHLAISRTPYYPAAMASRAWEQRALANRQYTPDCRLARRPRPPAEPVHGGGLPVIGPRQGGAATRHRSSVDARLSTSTSGYPPSSRRRPGR